MINAVSFIFCMIISDCSATSLPSMRATMAAEQPTNQRKSDQLICVIIGIISNLRQKVNIHRTILDPQLLAKSRKNT